jgi:hypothetical protein
VDLGKEYIAMSFSSLTTLKWNYVKNKVRAKKKMKQRERSIRILNASSFIAGNWSILSRMETFQF